MLPPTLAPVIVPPPTRMTRREQDASTDECNRSVPTHKSARRRSARDVGSMVYEPWGPGMRSPAGSRHRGGEIPQTKIPGCHLSAPIGRQEAGSHATDAGPRLVVGWAQVHVFRPAVLWIVLTLALAPNASALCRSWCDSHGSTATDCHHEASSPESVSSGDQCDTVAVDAAYLREEAPSQVATPDSHHAVLVSVHEIPRSLSSVAFLQVGRGSPPCDRRPLPIALRI